MSKDTEKPDFYNTICLADFFFKDGEQVPMEEAVEAATNMVKSMVDSELAKYITKKIVKPVMLDPKKSKYKLSTIGNFFNNKAIAKKQIESMETWKGVIVGSRDIRGRDTIIEEIRGQNYMFVLNDGKIKTFSGWGHKIGPSGEEIMAEHLSLVSVRVKPREKRGKVYWDGKYIEETVDIPPDELKKFLSERAQPIDTLIPDLGPPVYAPVLIRGRVSLIQPVTNWVQSDKLEVVKDENGNIVYERDEAGQYILNELKERVPKQEYPVVDDGIGQPIIQLKQDGTNKEQYVFRIMIVPEGEGTGGNVVTATFRNQKFGEQFILIPEAEELFKDAAKSPPGGREDGFAMLTSMWRNKEVVLAGTVTGTNKRDENSHYYRVAGTLVMDVTPGVSIPDRKEKLVEERHVSHDAPAPTPIQEMSPKVPEKTASPQDEQQTEEQPVAEVIQMPTMTMEEVMEEEEEEVVSPPSVTPTQQLKEAIRKAFNNVSTGITYESFMAMRTGVPEMFKRPEQKEVVKAFMDSVRISMKEPQPQPQPKQDEPPPTIVAETAPQQTSGPTHTREGQPTPSQIIAMTDGRVPKSMKEEQEQETVSAPPQETTTTKQEKIPPGHVSCEKCKKILAPHEVMTHTCDV